MPKGFTFIGPTGFCNAEYILGQLKNDELLYGHDELSASTRLQLNKNNGNVRFFTVGCFRIDIDVIKVSDLKAMRKLLPKTEYKLLKNRKCARILRSRRKKQMMTLLIENKRLKNENAELSKKLGLPLMHDYCSFPDVSSEILDCSPTNRKDQATFFSEPMTTGKSEENQPRFRIDKDTENPI